jgi:hypothetical protein
MKRFNFSSIGISPGETIEFGLDKGLVAIVIDDNFIEYDGKIMSTSGAALRILQSMGKKRISVRGPAMWRYKGKLLSDMVDEL